MRKQLFILALMTTPFLTGCYRQANEDFQRVDSQSAELLITAEVTEVVTAPVTGTPASEVTQEPQAFNPSVLPGTPTVIFVESGNPSSSTQSGVSPVQPSPVLLDPLAPTLLPTSTAPTLITPAAPGQLRLPTAAAEATEDPDAVFMPSTGVLVTPTDLAVVSSPECTYVVKSGDNLFRIAINNSTTVDELMAFNNLPSDRLQPGQELQLPDCMPGGTPAVEPAATEGGSIAAPATLVPSGAAGTQTVHVVSSGETLGSIARNYGVTIDAIVAANSLANPDQLAIGQELIIPPGA